MGCNDGPARMGGTVFYVKRREGVLSLQCSTKHLIKTTHKFVAVCFAVFMLCTAFTTAYAVEDETPNRTVGWFETVPISIFEGTVSPGTSGEHDFSIRNTSNYALNYELSFYGTEGAVPILYKLRSGDVYLVGSAETWVPATTQENAHVCKGTVPLNGKLDLTIEWCWPFDSENDSLDTEVGIAAPNEVFYISMNGTGRDANKAPIIVRSDFVEPVGPYLYPFFILVFGAILKISLTKYKEFYKERVDLK